MLWACHTGRVGSSSASMAACVRPLKEDPNIYRPNVPEFPYWWCSMARIKEFDPDVALERALDVFWEKGYEATSIADLVSATGVQRQSIYDTFGDKHRLFRAALDRYAALRGALALVLALVGDAAVPGQAQPLEHQRRAKDVAAEPLAAVTIGSSNGDLGVQVEALRDAFGLR